MTYSIVARDPETGAFGVAVQSHWFSVGPIVPWAQPGIGAVATQANIEVAYGPRGLAGLREGQDAQAVLDRLVAADPQADTRQVAIVDRTGRVAVHTGEQCMAFAGHAVGDGVSCQANIMAGAEVWPAMLAAYEGSSGELASRLMTALRAAEAAGGDLRGRQSAAILVVPADGELWDCTVALRVEDDPDPLGELERLLVLDEAYALAGTADTLAGEGRHDEAATLYCRALELAPGSDELRFWAGLGTAQQGDIDAGVVLVREAIAVHADWRELLGRLGPEQSPVAADVRARLDGR